MTYAPTHARIRTGLRRDQRGVAIIEFALSLPILMILILVGLELTNFVLANHRVRQLASMTADNASRMRTQMSEAFINQLFVGVQKSGSGIQFQQRGRVILSSVQNNRRRQRPVDPLAALLRPAEPGFEIWRAGKGTERRVASEPQRPGRPEQQRADVRGGRV